MNVIAAVDSNWGIGYKGKLLVQIPLDQKWFQTVTKDKVIVVGRKTLATFPNGLPLPSRKNIILSETPNFFIKGAEVAHNMEEAFGFLKEWNKEDIYIAGGESIYKQFLPYCKVAHITRIHYSYEADTWFPNLDIRKEWELTEESEEQTYFDLEYTFQKFERKGK